MEDLTEEELLQFLNSVDSDSNVEFHSDDDSVADPNFVVDDIEPQLQPVDNSDEKET